MRIFSISLLLFLGASSCGLIAAVPPPIPVAVPVSILPAPEGPAISRYLLGAQFAFSSNPIVERLLSDDYLATLREMPVTMMRYPGGTWADHYCWDNPAGSYFAEGNTRHVTPARFIEACRAIGAEPIFQVNTSSKGHSSDNRLNPTSLDDIRAGARSAAGWVREANVHQGWHVRYWEIGNETWIWLHPDEYARIVAEYSQAMREADPSIKIIACGLTGKVGPFDDKWLSFPNDPQWTPRLGVVNDGDSWDRALFAGAPGAFDYIAPHPYVSPHDRSPGTSAKEAALAVARDPLSHYLRTVAEVWEEKGLREQYDLLRKYDPEGRVHVALTEWITNFDHSVPGARTWDPGLYYYSLGNALNIAHYFGRIAERASLTDIAIAHSLEDLLTLYYWPQKEMAAGRPLEQPGFLALRIWGRCLGARMLGVKSGTVPALSIGGKEYPALFFYASQDGGSVYLVALNLDPLAGHAVDLDVAALGPLDDKAVLWRLEGPDLGAGNFAAWENAAAAPVRLVEERVSPRDGVWHLDLAAHSMVGLKISRKP